MVQIQVPEVWYMSTDAAILALRFSTSAGATVFEIDFKKIDYNGVNSRILSEIATRDSNHKTAAPRSSRT